ncbi:MAG: DNA topoisomerase VI subunit B [Planctomycetota bacterium]
MAKQQREISISEFFAKNRHLLGFDNKRKALLTTVKEAVDNSLDACEEAGILPDVEIIVTQIAEERFRVVVQDNGPGIVRDQIPNIFGKLLYGSKFHRLKMARGQQGIGISAAGMYGLITTGKPISIISRTDEKKEAHHFKVAIDTKKNRPEVVHDESAPVDWPHGTRVEIELEAAFIKGRQGIGEYIEQTAIANPHARITYHAPIGERLEYPRSVHELPKEPREVQPHPYGIELGTLMKMFKESSAKKVGTFLQKEFSRVSPTIAKAVCAKAGVTPLTWLNAVDSHATERIYNALQTTRIKAPSTDCLSPIGAEAILSGLLKGVKAEFYTAATRNPAVYRGNPFQVEVGLAYGGQLAADLSDGDGPRNGKAEPPQARVIRFANRVPLLYRQSACCTFKAVLETKWSNYGLSQPRTALPQAPLVLLIHLASVWVPFTSESKEAIADYDEIRKEIKLALAECGRRLGIYLRRKKKRTAYSQRRDVFTRYIGEVVDSVRAITVCDKDKLRRALLSLAEKFTAHADVEFDEHGNIVRHRPPDHDPELEHTIIVDSAEAAPSEPVLFPGEPEPAPGRRRARSPTKRV